MASEYSDDESDGIPDVNTKPAVQPYMYEPTRVLTGDIENVKSDSEPESTEPGDAGDVGDDPQMSRLTSLEWCVFMKGCIFKSNKLHLTTYRCAKEIFK